MCKVIQVIECKESRRGNGTADNPTRVVTQYFSTDGELLARVDPCGPSAIYAWSTTPDGVAAYMEPRANPLP